MSNTLNKCLAFGGFLAVVLILLTSLTRAAPYDDTVNKGFELLQQGKFQDAFTQAGKAIQLNATRHEAHFLGGLALYKLDAIDLSISYFQKALELSPAQQKTKLQEALGTAEQKKEFLVHVRNAQQAEGDGLIAKAAREYATAWEGFKIREDVGLKAAKLWAERLNNQAECARILSYIVSHPQDMEVLKQSKDLLERQKTALEAACDERVRAGQELIRQGKTGEAIDALTSATVLSPSRQDPHLHLARAYAQQNQPDKAAKELGQMMKLGPVAVESVFGYREFAPLLATREFTAFLQDTFGSDAVVRAQRKVQSDAEQTRQQVVAAQADRERQAAAEQAERERHAPRTCQKCQGSGSIKCGACNGSGEKRCASCSGSGKTTCAACSGHWSWTEYIPPYNTPYVRFCPYCSGGKVNCSSCDGRGKVLCTRCDGKGELTCSTCRGTGQVVPR